MSSTECELPVPTFRYHRPEFQPRYSETVWCPPQRAQTTEEKQSADEFFWSQFNEKPQT